MAVIAKSPSEIIVLKVYILSNPKVEEHAVVESHPANEMADLRLDRPFPGLVRYMDAMDLDSMDKQVRGYSCSFAGSLFTKKKPSLSGHNRSTATRRTW